MSDKNTFVILSPGFPESEHDSTCLPMQQSFVKVMARMYPSIRIVVLSFQYPYHRNTYRWFDVKVIPFNGRNRGGLTRIRLRKQIDAALTAIHNERPIAGILSFWTNECAWTGKKFANQQRLSHYSWILGQDAKKENKYPQRLKFQSEELIALSDFSQDKFEENHHVKPGFVIPPGIDPELFSKESSARDIDLLAVGSLIELKQYPVFLEVVARVKRSMPAIRAVLVGKGPEERKLRQLLQALDLQNNLTVTGELPHPEVLRLMQRTRVLLHPSSYESFGCVCLEALAAGAGVISFCKPMSGLIQNWYIVGNAEDMTTKAFEILEDPPQQYEPVVPFTMEDTVARIASLYGLK